MRKQEVKISCQGKTVDASLLHDKYTVQYVDDCCAVKKSNTA
jgi:hypothetical protein